MMARVMGGDYRSFAARPQGRTLVRRATQFARFFGFTEESSVDLQMAVNPDSDRTLVRTALFDAAGPNPGHAQIVLAFNSLCDRLGAVLEPLFGARAIDALFLRARHLAAREFPRLSGVLAKNERRCRVDALDGSAVADAELADLLTAVLAYKIELLITFVGEDLVMPLVRRAWPAAVRATSTTESK